MVMLIINVRTSLACEGLSFKAYWKVMVIFSTNRVSALLMEQNVFEYKIKHVDNSSVKTNETFIIIIKQKTNESFVVNQV